MRVKRLLGAATILCLALGGRLALADDDAAKPESGGAEKNWSVEVGYDYSSAYLFRGLDELSGEKVSIPRVLGTYGGLSAYYYGYFGHQIQGLKNYKEHDLGAEYAWALAKEKLSLTLGAVHYGYGNSDSGDATAEVYGIAELDVLLSPKISVYHDIHALHSWFTAIDIGHDFDLTKAFGMKDPMSLGIGLAGELSYDHDYVGPALGLKGSGGAFNNVLLGVDIPWQACKYFSLHALAQRSFSLHALDDIGQKSFNIYTGGFTITF